MANTKTDDLVVALDAVGGLTGSLADKQRQYLLAEPGVGTGSFADLRTSLGHTNKGPFLPVPLP